MIRDGKTVSIEYTLKLEDGKVVDSNVDAEPLKYVQGNQQILPALEEALSDLKVDDRKQVTLPPEKGYGQVDPGAFQSVPVDRLPEDARSVGSELMAKDKSGNRMQLRVHEIHGDKAILDLNHPLAGRTLHFDVRILSVE